MSLVAGAVGDMHELSERAREYANDVVFGEQWPLSTAHLDLDEVTFETSTRMERKHGLCTPNSEGNCTIRLSQKTYERGGFEAIRETVRHELVHVYQFQSEDIETGHGASFQRWVGPLDLNGRCSKHYDVGAEDYTYTFHCPHCGFIGGRYRMCKTVRNAADDALYCKRCESHDIELRMSGETVPTPTDADHL